MLSMLDYVPDNVSDSSKLIDWLKDQPMAPKGMDDSIQDVCMYEHWNQMPVTWFAQFAERGWHLPDESECKCGICADNRAKAREARIRVERELEEMSRREAERERERSIEMRAREARRTEMIKRASGSSDYMPSFITDGSFFVAPPQEKLDAEWPLRHEVSLYDTSSGLPGTGHPNPIQGGDLIKVFRGRHGKLYGKKLSVIEQKNPSTGEVKYKGRWIGIGTIWLTYLDEEGKLTPRRAAQLGHAFGFCVYCMRDLDDAESALNGMGRHCWNLHARPAGIPWKKTDGGVIK